MKITKKQTIIKRQANRRIKIEINVKMKKTKNDSKKIYMAPCVLGIFTVDIVPPRFTIIPSTTSSSW